VEGGGDGEQNGRDGNRTCGMEGDRDMTCGVGWDLCPCKNCSFELTVSVL